MEVKSIITGKRAVSLPFTDFCPVMCPDQKTFDSYIKDIIEYGKKKAWKYLELRSGTNFLRQHPPHSAFAIHYLNLAQNSKEIFQSFRSSTKRNIKKAQKSGLKIEVSNELEPVKTFYHLHCITRKRHGVPPQPFRFFRNIYRYVISGNKGLTVTASFKGNVVAAAIFFYLSDQAIYKFGASDLKYQNLRPNNLVMWEAIRYFAERGFKTFHFGRTEPENRGLLQFKRGWGTKEETLNYYRYDFRQKTFIQGSSKAAEFPFVQKIMQKLPIPALKILGTILYPHVA